MAISYLPFNNGDNLSDIRNILNAYNSTSANTINSNSDRLTTIEADKLIVNNKILELEGIVTNYSYSTITNILTLDTTTFSPILSLTKENNEEGTYVATLTCIYKYSSSDKVVTFRYSIDGGTTWVELQEGTINSLYSNSITYSVIFGSSITGDTTSILFEAKVEEDLDTLDILDCSISLERKA